MKFVGLFMVYTYRLVLSPHMGGACRFHPSCSEYSADAFKSHTFFKASKLTLLRVLKCNPFGPFGFDPLHKGSQDLHQGNAKGMK